MQLGGGVGVLHVDVVRGAVRLQVENGLPYCDSLLEKADVLDLVEVEEEAGLDTL